MIIYSPAPASNMLHTLNLDLGRAASGWPGLPHMDIIPVPLPDSINDIATMPVETRGHLLPIVTTVDFIPARTQTGPDWHGFNRANGDLKFVSTLYDVGLGVQAFDAAIKTPADLKGKRIGVPPRPSSVRVLSEALLRDGWGILDDVELVDIIPPNVGAAIQSGEIDATTWNMRYRDGPALKALIPPLLAIKDAHFLDIDDDALASINANNSFQTQFADLPGDHLNLLSFGQALAAWDSTDGEIVDALLECIFKNLARYPGLPVKRRSMLAWPALDEAHVHPAALRYYQRRGIVMP